MGVKTLALQNCRHLSCRSLGRVAAAEITPYQLPTIVAALRLGRHRADGIWVLIRFLQDSLQILWLAAHIHHQPPVAVGRCAGIPGDAGMITGSGDGPGDREEHDQ